MQGTAIIIGNMIGGITGGGGAILPTFYILGDGTIDGDNIIDESGDFLVSELAPNPAPYLLDAYTGASAGYSLRRLSSTYTGFAIKVQDNVGGATLDVGFDINRGLDTAAIAIYGGVNDVFVETWYDQSGNGNNAVQATSSLRPKIYDGTTGAVITENGKPAIYKQNQAAKLSFDSSLVNGANFLYTSVQGPLSGFGMILGSTFFGPRSGGNLRHDYDANVVNAFSTTSIDVITNQYILSSQRVNTTSGSVYTNGVITTNGVVTAGSNVSTSQTSIFYTDKDITMKLQEVIYYNSDQSANRTGIETNINDFYSIY
jgi:hypothetical protein